jgi:predicted nucleotidyltransferase
MAESDLHRIAATLAQHGVEFIVVGGQAEVLMGSPRVTYDVDLCYRRTPENLEKLATALKLLKPKLRGAPPDLPGILDARALSLGNNYTLETSSGSLDLLGWLEPLGGYEALLKNAETYMLGDLKMTVIGLDDLIQIKQHVGRTKDRESLWHLIGIQRIRKEKAGQ